MNIGILALQGGYQRHIEAFSSLSVQTTKIRYSKDFLNIDGLIIPGGESTALTKLIFREKLGDDILNFVKKKPAWGTCAGLILLASEIIDDEITKKINTFNMLKCIHIYGII